MALSALIQIMVDAVKVHALAHYEQNAWDTVVECWADDEIAQVIIDAKAANAEEAIEAMREEISHFAAYREDIQGTAF